MKPAASALVKVLCESCLQHPDDFCIICCGSKFYLWNPASRRCYLATGEPMLARNGSGKLVSVERQAPIIQKFTIESMLSYFELWAEQSKTRNWRLWFEDGWNCGYRHSEEEDWSIFSASDATECVSKCFQSVRAQPFSA
jgi:hypothetical protein